MAIINISYMAPKSSIICITNPSQKETKMLPYQFFLNDLFHLNKQQYTGSSCLMRISLLRIPLLRFFKTFQIIS